MQEDEKEIKTKIIILLLGLIPEALLESTLIPLFPYMVTHLLPNTTEPGYYVGLLGSAFYLPLFVMNIFWGSLSDTYGRKPILILGLVNGLGSTIILGLSRNYWLTLFCRFWAGCFGANSTVAKGLIGDLARDQKTRSWGYSMYGAVYGFSGIFGPLLAGILVNPVGFHDYPYILITFLVSLLGIAGLYLQIYYLVESNSYKQVDDEDVGLLLGASSASFDLPLVPSSSDPDFIGPLDIRSVPVTVIGARLPFQILSWNTLGPMFLYLTISFTNTTYNTSLPLFYSSPVVKGGLGLDAQATGVALSMIAVSKLFVQLFLFHQALQFIGSAKDTFRYGMILYVPNHWLLPLLAIVQGWVRFGISIIIMCCFGICESLGYLSVILLITESQSPENLGKAHGLASTLAALARTVSPTVAGALWEWSVILHWNWLVFFFGGVVAMTGAIAASGKEAKKAVE